MKKGVSLAWLIVLTASCALPALAAERPPPPDDPYALIAARLDLMEQVAAFKWLHKQPIEAPGQETQVLAQAARDALQAGIRPASGTAFFRAQIEAAKAVQHYWFARWRANEVAVPAAAPDLDRELRPELARLGSAIVRALAASPRPDRAAFDRTMTTEGLDDLHRDALYDAFANLVVYADRLEQILDSGVLRIGTTFDYPPFTFLAGDNPAGIDVELGRDLAASLGVQARFVSTSWPDLMADLRSGAFDVAMSGVSRDLMRQREGYFSAPYHAGGKTPIVRCAEVDRFDSLEAIDQPGVRVIVNPGGTNERFARERLKAATVIVHPDNRRVFAELVAGRADVMITDRIEVSLQSARNPELCSSMTRNLTTQDKGFLMPKDAALKAYVDLWLEQRLADGTVERLFAAGLR
jgi:cyclohexadienyl dehydratase